MVWIAPAPGIAMCQSVVSIKDHEQKEPSAPSPSILQRIKSAMNPSAPTTAKIASNKTPPALSRRSGTSL